MDALNGSRDIQSFRLWHAEKGCGLEDQHRPEAFAAAERGIAHGFSEMLGCSWPTLDVMQKMGEPFFNGSSVSLKSFGEEQEIPVSD